MISNPILTTAHFFPCSSTRGGCCFGLTAAATGLVGAAPGLGAVGGLNGAGPVLNAGFLCVFISSETFFRPTMKKRAFIALNPSLEYNFDRFYRRHPSLLTLTFSKLQCAYLTFIIKFKVGQVESMPQMPYNYQVQHLRLHVMR